MPRVAALLDVAAISDITGVVSADTFERPIYAGNAIATVQSKDPIKVVTVRTTAFETAAATGGSAPVEPVSGAGAAGLSCFVSAELTKSERPELTSARVVVSGGRNIEAPWAIFASPLPLDDFATMKPGFASMLQFKLLKLATPKSVRFSELYFLEAARKVRRSVSCKLGYVGGVLSLEAAQQVLNEGFDAVVMARSLVHDAALVQRFREDPAHRSGCTACNRCVAVMYGPSGTHCPLTGNMIDARLNGLPAGTVEQ
ncbi:hypothetical protein J2847_002703 [Azospirillum agricola]|nr:hypothetical protein [Azospirillum agricola]